MYKIPPRGGGGGGGGSIASSRPIHVCTLYWNPNFYSVICILHHALVPKDVVVLKTMYCQFCIYSKTCLKRSLKNRQTKVLKTNGSLMKVESIAECSLGAFCNTFDLH